MNFILSFNFLNYINMLYIRFKNFTETPFFGQIIEVKKAVVPERPLFSYDKSANDSKISRKVSNPNMKF